MRRKFRTEGGRTNSNPATTEVAINSGSESAADLDLRADPRAVRALTSRHRAAGPVIYQSGVVVPATRRYAERPADGRTDGRTVGEESIGRDASPRRRQRRRRRRPSRSTRTTRRRKHRRRRRRSPLVYTTSADNFPARRAGAVKARSAVDKSSRSSSSSSSSTFRGRARARARN